MAGLTPSTAITPVTRASSPAEAERMLAATSRAPSSSSFAQRVAAQRTEAVNNTPPATPHEQNGVGVAAARLLSRVARNERQLEGIVRHSLVGRTHTPAELLAVQANVYRFTQELELFSKLVEKGTGAVKTILQQNG